MVSIIVELSISNLMPALNASAIAHQLKQCFWGGVQAGQKQVGGPKGLASAAAAGRHLHDPVFADPGLADDVHRVSFARSIQEISRPWLIS